MTPAELIILESSSTWAVALRRQLNRDSDPRVYETRNLSDWWRQLASHPQSFVALEVNHANLESAVDAMLQLQRRFRRVRAAVLTARRWSGCEWLFRELGAVHLVDSRRALGPLVRMIRRHCCRAAARPSARQWPWQAGPWAGEPPWSGPAGPVWLDDKRIRNENDAR